MLRLAPGAAVPYQATAGRLLIWRKPGPDTRDYRQWLFPLDLPTRRGLEPQVSQDDILDVVKTLLDHVARAEVPAEDHGERALVREEMIGQSRYRDIKLDRINPEPEDALLLPAPQETAYVLDQLGIRAADGLRFPDVLCVVIVLGIEIGDEVARLCPVSEGIDHQPGDSLQRVAPFELHGLLPLA